MIEPQKVVIIGQGYVGLPISIRSVLFGHDVVGFEIDEKRAQRLKGGDSYIEDISNEVLAAALATGRFLPSSSIEDCVGFNTAVVTVPTPLREGAPDLSYIMQAAESLARLVTPGCTVILESTTYPGTTEELFIPVLETGSGLTAGIDFFAGYSPERIDPGNQTWRLENTPKVVSGVNAASLERVKDFYDSVVEVTVPLLGTREAELSKLLENTFRHVNIALVNELAMFASDLGVDVWEAIRAADTKPFGFMKFTPGPGVGGHCLPIDPSYLSWKVKQTLGMPFRFIELANDVNDHMPDYVARRATSMLNDACKSVKGSTILVLGLAYKKNTGDARESPGPVVCDRLVGLGANVRVADPHVTPSSCPSGATLVVADAAEIRQADLVVVITEHDAFDWDLIQALAPAVLDMRHRLEPGENVEYI